MDIDKLYLASFNFTKGKDGKITMQFDDTNYRLNDDPTNELNFKDLDLGYLNWKPKNERYRQAHIQNQLFSNFINLLKTCGSIDKDGNITYGINMHMLKRSIDNDTDLLNGEDGVLKTVDEAYSDSSSSIEEPFAYGSLSTLVNIMNAFITGKFGIGPFALHNNSHILTQLYQLSFRDGTNILNYLDALSLHEYIDKDGNSILSYLSALINANVDVAKDPYIQRLNVNLYTYDLITLLTRTGLGRNSFFFINQPVIRDLAVTYQNALGLLTESPELSDRERAEKEESDFITGKNFGKLLNDLISNSLNKFRSEKERTDASFSNKTIYRALFGEDGVTITNTKGEKINKSILEDILTNEEVRINPNKKLSIDNLKTDTYYLIKEGNNTYDLSPLEVQGFVYLAKREFNPYSESLSNLVLVTKIDTKKHGISELEQSEYLEKYQNLKKTGYKIFDKHLTDLLEKSFINYKTITAISLLSRVMNNQTISHTRTFKNMISRACSMMNNYSREFKKAIGDGIIAYLKLKCVNEHMRENGIDWTSMIVHSNEPTLAERYIKIMDKIKNDFTGSYQSFITNGVVLNSILDNLQRVAYSEPYGYDHYDLLTLGNTNDDSQEILNHFMDDWTQLYESSDEEIKQFAIDLAVYAFMTSADTRGFTKFFKYVPLVIREAIGYTDRLENIRYAFSVGYNDADVDNVLEEVIRNLWLNNNVIPTEELYKDVFDRDSASTVRVDVVVGPKLRYKDIKKNKGKTELYDRTDTFLLFAGITSFENGARLSIKQGSDGTYRRFIKIRRPGSRITDADPYLLYEFVGVGYNDIKGKNGNIIQSEYPMYAITYPKGFTVRVGNQAYSLYEYGRNDHYKHIINEDDFLKPDYQALIEYNIQKLTELKRMFPNDILLMSNNDDIWKLLEKVESLFGTQDYHDGVIAGNYFLLDNPVRNRLELRMVRDMYRIQEVNSDIFGPVTSAYNRSQVEKDIETLYIFTDNTDRSSGSNLISENNPYSWYLIKYGSDKPLMYPTKTQAVIRGLDNAYPISTQRHFNLNVEEGRWNDEDIEEFKQVIDDEIEEIRAAWDSGRYKRVRFGLGDGFFNSNISNISKERTPEIYKYLMRLLSDLESYITGEAPTKFKPDFEDDYEFMNEPQVLPTKGNTVQPKQQATINIYAGTGENADLSNFAGSPSTFILHSGGAPGSDLYWDEIAKQHGIGGYNHYYYGLRSKYNSPGGNVEITAKEYEEGRVEAARAAARNWGYKLPKVNDSRLARNWMLVKNADAVFAVGHIAQPGERAFPNIPDDTRTAINPMVTGGTGYAVGMAILHNKPVYVFDLQVGKWYTWDPQLNNFVETDMPTLTQNFAGIGIRGINDAGRQAIQDIFNKTFNSQLNNLPGPETKMNIWWGSGEEDPNRQNADLSNFAERPFVIPEDFFVSVPSMRDISYGTIGINDDRSAIKYRSVEAAFQGIKSTYSETDYPTNTDFEALRKQGLALRIQDFAKMSGAEAKKNGRNVTDLDELSWDKDSSIIMKALIKLSFEQNPQALQRLLATDNATLTHTQDKSKWGTEFPRLLMEVRDELRQSTRQQQFATGEFYTKTAVYDYINDLVDIEGVSRDNIEVKHVPETDTEDEYWTVSVKDNSNDWNNSDEYSDEEMNHCK